MSEAEVLVQKAKDEQSEEAPVVQSERDVERLFEDFFHNRWLRPWSREWPGFDSVFEKKMPRLDIIDREHEIVVRAELPGMTSDDLEVSVGDNTLSLKGSSKHEEETEEGEYHRRETSSTYISRTVTLPARVHGDDAKAKLRDGMLEVTVPKSEESRRRRIEVDS
jgi:HSP20 family protein